MRERRGYLHQLGSLRVPALAIGAELDQAAPPDTSRVIAAGIPGCRLAIIPSAGHLANLEDVKAFNAPIIEFMAALDQS
jgi:pimeloyl-ACP methyl ester carboxylesterase